LGGGFGGGGLDGDFNGFCRGSMVIMERVSDCCGGGSEVAEIAGWVHFLNLERRKEGRKEEKTVRECQMRVRFYTEGFGKFCNNVKDCLWANVLILYLE
jgi:hypothetical protein